MDKFGSSIRCDEQDINGKLLNRPKDSCRVFRYLQSGMNLIRVSTLNFPNVLLTADNNKRLKMVSLVKVYLKADLDNSAKSVETNFNNLKIFLTSFLNMPAKKNKSEISNEYYITTERIWEKDGIKYVLSKTKFQKRRKDQILKYAIELCYYNPN